ncbi:DUF3347 domain-containing protein [Puniceicoccaceae bacterium K14]|nr:DUF3347 domain-containing protein [Puniceicoccaceae bacterium K14]
MNKLILSVFASIAFVSISHAHCGNCASGETKEAHHHGEEASRSSVELDVYFGVQSALAGDDLATAQSVASKLIALAEEKGCSLKFETASVIAEAKDISTARDAFKDWSDALIEKFEEGYSGEGAVYKMHCPMAFGNTGGSWLQNNKELLNPYYGAMMLRCGMVQKDYAK